MLSGETAIGRYPLQTLRMMDRIVRAAESADLGERGAERRGERRSDRRMQSHAAAVTHAAKILAEDLDAAAIVGMTRTGRTAELLSRQRASVPIFAFSPEQRVCRRLALWWGVTAVFRPLVPGLEPSIETMKQYLLRAGAAHPGDIVVIAGSHPFKSGVHSNFVKFEVLAACP
jgi:pyruvate kinase